MTFTLTFAWWHIPAAITILSFMWALFWPADDGGFMGGIVRILMLLPALFISMAAWMIAGFFK